MLAIDKVLAGWKVWGIPALVAVLAPWQQTITGLELISNYFQPGLNGFATAVGALGAMVGYAFLGDQSRKAQRRWALWSGLAFALCLVVCMGLKLTLGTVLFPEPGWFEAITLVHELAYVGIFGASCLLIMCLLLAGTPRPGRPAPAKPDEAAADP
jgi:uncharacterized membrane protein YhdT